MLSHKHPEDYEQPAATIEDIRQTHKPFSIPPSQRDAMAVWVRKVWHRATPTPRATVMHLALRPEGSCRDVLPSNAGLFHALLGRFT
jgi:hypothetical protein